MGERRHARAFVINGNAQPVIGDSRLTTGRQLEFFILRYVPDAVKEECVNVGVVLLEPAGEFAEVRFTRDWSRVRCIDPQADFEVLEALEADLRARLGQGGAAREQILKVLGDSFSNQLQVSERKACLAESPQAEIESLAKMYLEPRARERGRERGARMRVYGAMRDAFEREGVWELMWRGIPASEFTRAGDPLKVDCGYQPNGVVRMFHAVSLEPADAAKALAFSVPQLRAGVERVRKAELEFTAVVEQSEADEAAAFARETLERGGIVVAQVAEMSGIAERARRELLKA